MNKRLFGLQVVSEARNFIYGIAIIWIMFFHCGLRPVTATFNAIKGYGDCGVEIFFFLSGICLFFSFDKDRNPVAFYKRRFLKILPPYLIVYGIVFMCIDLVPTFNIGQFLLDYSLLDFWFHGLGRAPWFVEAIIVFYLAYPLIYNLFFGETKQRSIKLIAFFAVVIVLGWLLIKYRSYLNIFTIRIPIFILGCFFGKFVHDDYGVKPWHLLLLAVFFGGSLALFLTFRSIWWLRNLFFVFLALSLILVLSGLYKLFNRFAPILNKPIVFLGGLTLEIYLCHEKIQESLLYLLRRIGFESAEFADVWYQWLCIVLTVLVAIDVRSLVKALIKLSRKIKERKSERPTV